MGWPDEFRTLRERVEELARRVDQWLDDGPGPRGAVVAQIIDGGSIPDGTHDAGYYFLANPVKRVLGTGTEGDPVNVELDTTTTIAVIVYGPAAVGDYVLAKQVASGRWATDTGRGCPNWKITVSGVCGGYGAGATVTIGTHTQTTDASGVATFPAVSAGQAGSITGLSDFYDRHFTVPAACTDLAINIYPKMVSVRLRATVCNVAPSSSYPVTASLTQTLGGSYSGSCTINSSSGCTMPIPGPDPEGSTDFTFSVDYTASGFIPVTGQTFNVSRTPVGWQCNVLPQSIDLVTPAGNYCDPNRGCIDAAPSTLTATFSLGFGPYVLANVGTAGNLGYFYEDALVWVGFDYGGGVALFEKASGHELHYSLLVAGTNYCPVAATFQRQENLEPPVPGDFCTIS